MKWRKTTYVIHRWLGLFICLQLLAWSTGGFVFSILALDLVRGERDSIMKPFDPIDLTALDNMPSELHSLVQGLLHAGTEIGSISFQNRGRGPVWEIRDSKGTLVSVMCGDGSKTVPLLGEQDAGELAQRDFAHDARVRSVRLLVSDPPVQYRSGVLPAYEVALDHSRNPYIYVDAWTGAVTARRNRQWRIFDFFWMLHTMDYSGRDDFNHPLLTGFSILAILTALTGLTLWAWRAQSRWKRRSLRRTQMNSMDS